MRTSLEQFGRRLRHRGSASLATDGQTCSVCHRTPLVGERVHLYANGTTACALCRPAKRGEPEQTVLVLHTEFGHAVKPRARIAL